MTESAKPSPDPALSDTEVLEQFAQREYTEGFYTDVESDSAPPGLDEGTIADLYELVGERRGDGQK
ncbi:MAG: hypothetical protein QF411_05470 [Planctomycetota bacterium]|nr:hypothetical protein [Planctomycetota bacterium]